MATSRESIPEYGSADGIGEFLDHLVATEGVISLHSKHAPPMTILIALVDSDEAYERVFHAEQRAFKKYPYMAADLHIYVVELDDVAGEQAELAKSSALVWSKN